MKKFLLLVVFFSVLGMSACTIFITEGIREQTRQQQRQTSDSTAFFVPNLKNVDSNFVSIENILATTKVKTDSANIDFNALVDSTMAMDSVVATAQDSATPLLTIRIRLGGNSSDTLSQNNDTTEQASEKPDTSNSNYMLSLTNLDASYYPDSVIMNVTVQNSSGEFIAGLAPPYLAQNKTYKNYWKLISDSCKNTNNNIDSFAVEEIRAISSQQKHNICFVLDHSSSMSEALCVTLQQGTRYASTLVQDGDYLSAIKFGNKAFLEVEPTTDKAEFANKFKINGRISAIKHGGGTNILLALDSAISTLGKMSDNYKRVVILFTDGGSSMAKLKQVARKYLNKKCKVYPICYSGSSVYAKSDLQAMENIAKQTNGKVYKIKDIRDFSYVFKEIYTTLTNYYKITYTPSQCADLHNVAINVELPTIKNDTIINTVFTVNGEYDKSAFANFAEVGTMQLMDIEFEYAKATIDSNSIPVLLEIAKQLKRNEHVRIQIAGHTDNIGNDEYNEKLSLERANSVKKFLVENEIDAARIETVGYGKQRPIAENDTEENKKRNRRTEFIVIE